MVDRESMFRGVQSLTHLLSVFDKDLLVGAAALEHYFKGSWWEWQGSSLLFWRWPTEESIQTARDGFPIWVSGPLPKYK